MRNRFRSMLAIVAMATFVGVLWLVLRPPPNPLYQGKPLTVWLQEYATAGGLTDQTWKRDADEAVRQIGTNAFPMLLSMLQARDSDLTLQALKLAKRQSFIKINHVPARTRCHEAGHAFRVLGPGASNTVPALLEIYRSAGSPESRCDILVALGYIGPAARSAIPLLLQAAKGTNDLVQAGALWSLGSIHSEPEIVVPVMIACLQSPNESARLFAAQGLENFGTNARLAAAGLQGLLKDGHAEVRAAARHALGVIDPEAVAKPSMR